MSTSPPTGGKTNMSAAPVTTALRLLYGLSDEILPIYSALAELDGEITPEIERALLEAEGTLEAKAERILQIIANLEADAGLFQTNADRFFTEATRISHRAGILNGNADRLRELLRREMERAGMKSLEAGTWRVTRCKAGQPSVKWNGAPEEIPVVLRADQPPPQPKLDRHRALRLWQSVESGEEGLRLPKQLSVTYTEYLRIS